MVGCYIVAYLNQYVSKQVSEIGSKDGNGLIFGPLTTLTFFSVFFAKGF